MIQSTGMIHTTGMIRSAGQPTFAGKAVAACRHPARALLTSSVFMAPQASRQIGEDCYSYYYVYRAFAPLLSRWAQLVEIEQPEAQLTDAIECAREQCLAPVHLSFLPPQYVHLNDALPTVAFPFWEYPDIPACAFDGNPRYDWVRVCQRLAMILTACEFTRDAFLRAGVRTPIHVVPVPIQDDYFQVMPWSAGSRIQLDCSYHLLVPEIRADGPGPAEIAGPLSLGERARWQYRNRLKPYLPSAVGRCLGTAGRVLFGRVPELVVEQPAPPMPPTHSILDLEGVVYTSILNPFDLRKNWQDMIAAFLEALGDKDDALLVLKLAVPKRVTQIALDRVFEFYRLLESRQRARIAVITAYLSDHQMRELAAGSTWYLNASRAEGACLPLQDFLAAGRPGIAPRHTALAEYVDESLAFIVDSQPEPTFFSWDPSERNTTTWQRIDRKSLSAAIRASYNVAKHEPNRYQAMACAGRERMKRFASDEAVWPRLAAALDLVRE
jgi:glycosyltransferase involved in cell wall biosynthesis